MEDYMESELSGIFSVKLVTKNIVRGCPGTQFMHIRVNALILILNSQQVEPRLVIVSDMERGGGMKPVYVIIRLHRTCN